jgi:hypothetical protein
MLKMKMLFIFKRNTPQLAAAGIKGMRIQFRLRSAWPGSNFMRQRLGCPAACGVGALPPFHFRLDTRGRPRKYSNQKFGKTILSKAIDARIESTYKELSSLADRIQEHLPNEISIRLDNMGKNLWDVIIPKELKQEYWLFSSYIKSIVINSDEPWIPWEIIKPYDRDLDREDPYWCKKFAFARWFSGPGPEEDLRLGLVLPVAPDRANLDHLQEEVTFMEQLNELCPDITCQPHCHDYEDVLDWLNNKNFCIMHFTSHCQLDDHAIRLNHYPLRPTDINTKFGGGKRLRPLIFINACHSGRTGFELTLLGGWPMQLLDIANVGAFIGTMWEIDDLLAVQFAKSFYTKLIRDKQSIADAFRDAREDIRNAEPHNSSWLAYVLYADPYAKVPD